MKVFFTFLFSILLGFSANAKFKKVVMIVFENTNYSSAIKQTDFKRVSELGVSFSDMLATTHPSQPNYIALIAGSTLGVKDNKNVDLDESHLGDLLEKKGLDWRVYAESYPGQCFLGSSKGDYFRKHVPFLSFKNVSSNLKRCAKIENEVRFLTDWQNGNLPAFSLYIPNDRSNGHDTGIDYAGAWLKKNIEPMLREPTLMRDTLVIITFDESGASLKNKIYTAFIGDGITAKQTVSSTYTHMSLLKFIEDNFQIGHLGRDDASAKPIVEVLN